MMCVVLFRVIHCVNRRGFSQKSVQIGHILGLFVTDFLGCE